MSVPFSKTFLGRWLAKIIPVSLLCASVWGLYWWTTKDAPKTTPSATNPAVPPPSTAPTPLPVVPPITAPVVKADANQERYDRALKLAENQEKLDEARAAMRALAPVEDGGWADAHWWLVRDLLGVPEQKPAEALAAGGESKAPPHEEKPKAEPKTLTLSQLNDVQKHLEHVMAQQPDRLEAIELLAGIYVRRQQPDKAITLLEAGVERHLALRLALAGLHKQRGNTEAASKHARIASDHYRQQAAADPKNVDDRLLWAQAEIILGQDNSVLDILERGQSLRRDPRYDAFRVAWRVNQFREALVGNPPDLPQAWEAVEDAVKVAPQDRNVIDSLGLLAGRPDTRGRVKGILDALLGRDATASSAAYVVRGALAGDEGNYAEAIGLLEKALELSPNEVAAKNNLAWCLAQTKPPQLERALELANQAVFETSKAGSSSPAYLETRGQILIQLGKHKEGAVDLEQALRFMPPETRKKVHAALAEAYGKLGSKELSQTHRRLASVAATPE